MERFFHDPRNIRSFSDDVAVFNEGFARAGDVDLLKDVAAHHAAVDLACDADEWDTVRESSRDPGDQIGRAGAARRDSDADLAGDPGIAARLVGGVLLLPYEDRLNVCIKNTVKKGSDRYSGIAEDIFHALFLQAFHDCIRSYHLEFLLNMTGGQPPVTYFSF